MLIALVICFSRIFNFSYNLLIFSVIFFKYVKFSYCCSTPTQSATQPTSSLTPQNQNPKMPSSWPKPSALDHQSTCSQRLKLALSSPEITSQTSLTGAEKLWESWNASCLKLTIYVLGRMKSMLCYVCLKLQEREPF